MFSIFENSTNFIFFSDSFLLIDVENGQENPIPVNGSDSSYLLSQVGKKKMSPLPFII